MRLSFIPAAAAAALQLLTASCAGTDASGNSYFGTVETAEAVSVVKSSDGKAVVVDREGKELAGPFDALGELHDGRMVYRTGEYTDSTTAAYGYVDEKGSTVIPAVYASASDFSEGLAFVAPRDSSLRAIDRDGKVVFTVPDAVTVNVFMGGYAQASDISGRVWLLDREGERLDFPDTVSSAGFVAEGFIVGRVGDVRRLYKVKDKTISRVEELDNFSLQSFDARLQLAIVKSGDNYGLASVSGEYVVNPQYRKLKFDGGYICFSTDAGKIGFLDGKGKVVVDAVFDDVRFRSDNADGDYFIVSRDGKLWEIIDNEGKTVIPADYDRIMHLCGDLYAVGKDGKVGIADASRGKVTCEPQFADVVSVGRVIFASAGGAYAVVNSEGKMLGAEAYSVPETYFHDYAESQALTSQQRAEMIAMIMGSVDFGLPMPELAERYGLDKSLYNSQPGEWPLAQGAVPGMEFILVGGFRNGPVASGQWNASATPDNYILVAYFPDTKAAMDVVGLLTSNPDWVVDKDYGTQALSASPAIRFTATATSHEILVSPEEE